MKSNKKIIWLLAVSLLVINYCKKEAKAGAVPEISMSEFIEAYDSDPTLRVLDVRTQQEYAEGHVPGAILLPLDQLLAGAEVPFGKDSEFYVICRSGNRSMTAVSYLIQNGYESTASISGGTSAWIASGKDIEK